MVIRVCIKFLNAFRKLIGQIFSIVGHTGNLRIYKNLNSTINRIVFGSSCVEMFSKMFLWAFYSKAIWSFGQLHYQETALGMRLYFKLSIYHTTWTFCKRNWWYLYSFRYIGRNYLESRMLGFSKEGKWLLWFWMQATWGSSGFNFYYLSSHRYFKGLHQSRKWALIENLAHHSMVSNAPSHPLAFMGDSVSRTSLLFVQ